MYIVADLKFPVRESSQPMKMANRKLPTVYVDIM